MPTYTPLPPDLQARVDRLATEADELKPYVERLERWLLEAQQTMREVNTGRCDLPNGDYDWDEAEHHGVVPIIDLRGDLNELGDWAIDA